MTEKILFGRRRIGKIKKILEMLDIESVEFHFSFNDLTHEKEIRQQIIAMTGHDCKISWWVDFDRFLKYKQSLKGEE